MAKTTSWTGSASTDPDAVANWDNGVPVSTDTALLPASGKRALIPTGAGWGAIQLALLDIQPGFRFGVGASGNPLVVGATKLIHRGLSTLEFEGALGGTTDEVIINCDKVGPRGAVVNGSGIARVLIVKGHVVLDDLPNLVRLEITYRTNPLTDSVVTATDGAAALTFVFSAGQYATNTLYQTTDMSDGVFTYTGDAGLTTVNLMGGRLVYNGSGTLANANLVGGELDFSANPNEVTITDLWKLRDATLIRSELLTVTNEHDMTGGD